MVCDPCRSSGAPPTCASPAAPAFGLRRVPGVVLLRFTGTTLSAGGPRRVGEIIAEEERASVGDSCWLGGRCSGGCFMLTAPLPPPDVNCACCAGDSGGVLVGEGCCCGAVGGFWKLPSMRCTLFSNRLSLSMIESPVMAHFCSIRPDLSMAAVAAIALR